MADNNAQKKKKGGLREYFKGIRTELKKVIWPTKKEIGSYTTIVIITCAFFALAIWLLDTGTLAVLRGILKINM